MEIKDLFKILSFDLLIVYLFLNNQKWDYVTFLILFPIMNNLLIIKNRNMKRTLFIALIIGLNLILLNYVFNYGGHDYIVYSDEMRGRLNDSFISWIIMKIFTLLLGNPSGLYILSYLVCLSIFFIFQIKMFNNKKMFICYLYPVILLADPSFRYLSSGILRNLIAFLIISLSFTNLKIKKWIIMILLAFTHIPSLIYFTIYRIFKRDDLKRVFIQFSVIFLLALGIGFLLGGEAFQTVIKPIEIVYVQSKYITFQHLYNHLGFHGWNNYSILILSFITFFFSKYLENKKENILIWLRMLIIPFIPIFNWRIMIRFLWVSWFPVSMILEDFDDMLDSKLFIFLYSTFLLGARWL